MRLATCRVPLYMHDCIVQDNTLVHRQKQEISSTTFNAELIVKVRKLNNKEERYTYRSKLLHYIPLNIGLEKGVWTW
jgi:hypothetical protein